MIGIGDRVHRIIGATLLDGGTYDLTLHEGVVGQVLPCSPSDTPDLSVNTARPGELDLTGWLLLPSAVEPHAHVDKAFSWQHVEQTYGDLMGAINSWHGYSDQMSTEDVYLRAKRAFSSYLDHGITAVRTHVDLLTGPQPFRGLQAVLRLREELRQVMHIELVLLASSFSSVEDVRTALTLGVDVMGGCPHLAADPDAETRYLLDLADEFGLPVDLHTDEQLDPDMLSIRLLASEVGRRGLSGRAAASHCVSLGSQHPDDLAPLVKGIYESGLSIVSLPITNLYLQGRDDSHRTPRGITALQALITAGVNVTAGGDNIRDPFNPMGRADPFETTSLLITAGHLNAEQALDAVTSAGRRVLGLPQAGTKVGDVADLVAVKAATLADALAGPGDGRVVIYQGRLVSRTYVSTDNAIGN